MLRSVAGGTSRANTTPGMYHAQQTPSRQQRRGVLWSRQSSRTRYAPTQEVCGQRRTTASMQASAVPCGSASYRMAVWLVVRHGAVRLHIRRLT